MKCSEIYNIQIYCLISLLRVMCLFYFNCLLNFLFLLSVYSLLYQPFQL